jgi:hypothetical protein
VAHFLKGARKPTHPLFCGKCSRARRGYYPA